MIGLGLYCIQYKLDTSVSNLDELLTVSAHFFGTYFLALSGVGSLWPKAGQHFPYFENRHVSVPYWINHVMDRAGSTIRSKQYNLA